jgi:tight adherence protein B
MYINENVLIFVIIIFCIVFSLILLGLFLIKKQQVSQYNDRLRYLGLSPVYSINDESTAQNAALQRVLRARLSEIKKIEKGGFRLTINNLLLRSGSNYKFKNYILYSISIYFVFAMVIYFLSSNIIIAAFCAVLPGLFAQNIWLSLKVKRRQKQFTSDFAGALDIIVRGVTVGLSINESMKTVAYEAQGPVSEEFKRIVDGQAMGIDFDETLEEAINRMPTPEFRFFSIVMQIQRQTGGSMAKTLADLSALLRGRKEMRDKINALSSEAKSSAMIIGCLPLFITGLLYVMSPDFLDPLLNSTVGQFMIGGAIALMVIGVLVMRAMINFKF